MKFKLDNLWAMELIHIFYKEIAVDENNSFTVNTAEENEVEEVRFKYQKNMLLLACLLTKTLILV